MTRTLKTRGLVFLWLLCGGPSALPVWAQPDAPPPPEAAPPFPPAPLPLTPAPPRVPGGGLEFIPLRHVFFEHDQARLTEQTQRTLDEAALYLSRAQGISRVLITAHADSTAGESYNDALSDRRAAAVRDYLIAHGVQADLLRPSGWGEHGPIDENWTRAGRDRNRRVEIYVVRHTAPRPPEAATAPAPAPSPPGG